MAPSASASFASTHWTLILEAARAEDPAGAQAALADLCRIYWPPLYAHLRRKGYSADDAQDLTQGFFARLLRLDSIATARRERGRFRAFLLGSLNHYLADARDHAHAARRDERLETPLDAVAAEGWCQRGLVDPAVSPDAAFDRQWALALLDQVAARLKSDYVSAGQAKLFEALGFCLTGARSELPYANLAAQLGMTEAAVRVAVHRLRKRYRQLLRDEIAHTVADPAEIEEELRHLRQALVN